MKSASQICSKKKPRRKPDAPYPKNAGNPSPSNILTPISPRCPCYAACNGHTVFSILITNLLHYRYWASPRLVGERGRCVALVCFLGILHKNVSLSRWEHLPLRWRLAHTANTFSTSSPYALAAGIARDTLYAARRADADRIRLHKTRAPNGPWIWSWHPPERPQVPQVPQVPQIPQVPHRPPT